MIKIGILTCIHSNDVCARVGCLNAFYDRKNFFADYPKDARLTALFTCNGCEEERPQPPNEDKGILEKIERLKKEQVSVVHVGICRLKEDGTECERITQIISMLEQGGIRVFLGTHRE